MPWLVQVSTQMMVKTWRVPERPSPLDAQCHTCVSPSLVHDDIRNAQVTKFVFVANGDEKVPLRVNR